MPSKAATPAGAPAGQHPPHPAQHAPNPAAAQYAITPPDHMKYHNLFLSFDKNQDGYVYIICSIYIYVVFS